MNDSISASTTSIPKVNLGPWFGLILNESSSTGDDDDKIVSNATVFIFQAIFFVALCGSTSFLGIIANIINIVVFYRQGVMTDSSNVSLLGLAIADFFCLITLLWLSICYAFVLSKPPGLSWDPFDVLYLTAGWPHIMFAQITCAITSYIAFERCMCVVFPFKVKSWFSAKKSLIIVSVIFFFFSAFYAPVFAAHRLIYKVNTETNTSYLRLTFTHYRHTIQKITHYTSNITLTTLALCIVAICTKITASRIVSSKDWRQSMASSGAKPSSTEQNDNLSDRTAKQNQTQAKIVSKDAFRKETRLVRMITLISTVFLICYLPGISVTYLASIEPEVSNKGRYRNLFQCFFSISFFTETICSSINIFIYYNMSSRYRQEFRQWLGLTDKNK